MQPESALCKPEYSLNLARYAIRSDTRKKELPMCHRFSFASVPALILASAVAVPALAQPAQQSPSPRPISPEQAGVQVETVTSGLEHPWGLDFLPDGRMLVTEQPGRLRIVTRDGEVSEPIKNVPEVYVTGQGGLLDVLVDPDFESNRTIYLSYSEAGEGSIAGTAVARARLNKAGTALEDVAVIWRQQPKVKGPNHFGSRLVFGQNGKLFITTGERFQFQPAQDLSSGLGKVIRVNPDGSVPEDNPFVDREGAQPQIWSYGHRNVQGAAIHPETGQLWTIEFGPFGGDELNAPKAGGNYGWPIVSWGMNYDGTPIPDPPTHPELADAVYYWNPVISPSGMIFYTGELFADWQGDILIASLGSVTSPVNPSLVRLALDGNEVAHETRIGLGARIRDVAQGPGGAVFVLTDQTDGEILRLTPANP